MRTAKLTLAALPLLVAAAACAGNTTEYPAAGAGATTTTDTSAGTTTASGTTTSTTTTTVVTTTATDTAGAATTAAGAKMFQFSALNNSGFTGGAALTPLGAEKTRVTLMLTAPANTDMHADHNAHVYTGSCAAPNVKVADLHDVQGDGKPSDTEVDLSIGQLMDGGHVVIVNENPGDRPITCVQLPRAM